MEAGLFTTRPAKRFRLTLGGALLVSLLIHVLLLAWVQFGGVSSVLMAPIREAALVPPGEARKSPVESLQFTFVDIPNDQAVAENARARLLSDKTRKARQPVPTPPDAKNLGPDPHSEGNSRLRQIAGGGPPPSAPAEASPPPSAGRNGGGGTPASAGGPPGTGTAQPGEGGERSEAPDSRGEGTGDGENPGSGFQGKREAFQRALKQLESGTYDFSNFDNPAYLQGGNYGTLSFDTKGFDWGDYARQLYLIIKKNWYDRIPIAAYYGQKGKVFIRFVIEKDGSISDLAILRSSDISPFDRAAENAIRASNPLPHLPSNFPKQREGVTFGFYYNIPIDEP
jgi:TonB family protein